MRSLLCLIPLLGAIASAVVSTRSPGGTARPTAIAFAVVTLALGIVAVATHDDEDHTWIKAFGAHYALGVDGLGLLMVLLTVVLVPIVIVLAAWRDDDRDPAGVLRLGAGARGVRARASSRATDVFLFYVVFEATLIPAYFLIGGFGGEAPRGRG